MKIREEKSTDFDILHDFIRTAFSSAEVSDGDESDFTDRLRAGEGYLPHLALVAEKEGEIIGHVMATRFPAARTKGVHAELALIAPLSVALEHRSQGVGSALMREVLRRTAEAGFEAALLVGNPDYYARFGFQTSTDYGIRNTDGIPDRYVQIATFEKGTLASTEGTVTFAGM